jgi:ribosomal protein S20
VEIEAKERLRNISRKLADKAFAKACDPASNERDFQESLDAFVNHMKKVRKRAHELHMESQMA